MKKIMLVVLILLSSFAFAEIKAPQLKWSHKGGGPYIMNGSYAGSPAVADLDGDGRQEVIWANYMVYVLDGETGNLIWNAYTGHDKTERERKYIGTTFPGVVVADIDNDNRPEIVTGHEHGYVAVYTSEGLFHSSKWPIQLAPESEIRSLCVADLDNDHQLEILAGSTRKSSLEYDWYILKSNGDNFNGWPQAADYGCSHGAFNQNMAVGDLDQDGFLEIIAIATASYLNAFEYGGKPIKASSVYGNKLWGDIPIWFKYTSEIAGHAESGEYFPKFPFSAPIISDVDFDGSLEVIIVSYVHNLIERPAIPMFHVPVILNSDRDRYHKNGFDWRNLPTPKDFQNSPPLSDDYRDAKVCNPNAAAADIDNDGFQEIIFPANDGKVHAYWLDQTEHDNWPFSVYDPGEKIFRFASECTIADLDGDNKLEIIFGTWPARDSHKNGHLYILDHKGNPLHKIEIPSGNEDWSGITSAPTIANIDEDADYELVVGTAWSGLCAYDLPNTAGAKIYWQTGQGNFQRTGCVVRQNSGHQSGIEKRQSKLLNFELSQNYPNPFHKITHIPVQVKSKTNVNLEIYDILGRKVRTLHQGLLTPGKYSFKFDANNSMQHLPGGVYYCMLKGNGQRVVSKIMYLH